MNTYLCFEYVGAGKSTRSASRFNVSDLQEYASSRSIKKELATSPKVPNPKGISTRGKGTKKRKADEPAEGFPLFQRQFEEYVSEVRILYP